MKINMQETRDIIRWKNLCNFLDNGGASCYYGVSEEDAEKVKEDTLKEIREIEEKYNLLNKYEVRV